MKTKFRRIVGKYRRFASIAFARRPWRMQNTKALVSFSFDDFPESALRVGGEILNRHGFRGTYYISAGLLGRSEPTGQIVAESDLKAVLHHGHELGCHTFAHCDASVTAPDEFEKSIIENRQALARLVPGATLRSLSYPIGTPKPAIKRRSERHFSGCRAGGQTHNLGEIDLNYIKAFFIEQSAEHPEKIHAALKDAIAARGWLVFATHDVSDQPTKYGCTPALFAEIAGAVADSAASVLPVSEALEAIGVNSRI